MFDAGAIQAHLDVETSAFDRKMDAAEARVKRFENEKHEVKLSAVFDDASMGRARQMFAQLDNQLSRDAASRLRGSPQGSVLGSLNALFSPHPISGGPTAAQSLAGGAIGKMAAAPATMLPSSQGGATPAGLGRILVQQAAGTAQPSTRQPDVIAHVAGTAAIDAATAAAMTGTADAAKVSADAAKDAADKSADAAKDSASASKDAATGIRGMMSGLTGLLGKVGIGGDVAKAQTAALSTAGKVDQSFIAKVLGAAGPGMGALGTKAAGIIGGGGALLGAVPALVGGLAPLLPGAAAAGVIGLGAKQLIGTSQAPGQLYGAAQTLSGQVQPLMKQAMQPLVAPLEQAFKQIPGMIKGLMPDIKNLFASAATFIQPFLGALSDIAKDVLPGLSQAMRIAAPLIRPLLDGFGLLVKNIFPGLNTLLKAAAPAVKVVAQVLGELGGDLGKFFGDMAPALQASGVLLKAVFGLIGSLLPIISQLAGVFAKALAPVIGGLAGAFKALEPSLIIIGRIFGELAGAILTDLSGALQGVATLLGDLAPSFVILASVMGQVFNTLESSGVFGTIASVLEQLAPLLANLINALVKQLVPILPILVTLFSQVSTIMIDLFAAGLTVILTSITWLIDHCGWLVKALGLLGVAWIVLNAIMSVSPMGALIFGIVALIGAVALLVTHWRQAWTDIKNWAKDAWEFLTHGWGQFIILPLTEIRLAVEFTRDHWKQAWTDIKNWTVDAWHAVYNEVIAPIERTFTSDIPHWWDLAVQYCYSHWVQPFENAMSAAWRWVVNNVFDPMENFVTQTVPGWWDDAVKYIGQMWDKVEDIVKIPVKFVIDDVLDGLISVFDDITKAVGLGSPIGQVHPMGLAAGGKIGVGTGPTADDVLIRVSRGETVVSAADSARLAPLFAQMGIPGYATGGAVKKQTGQAAPGGGILHGIAHAFDTVRHGIATVSGKAIDIGKLTLAFATGNEAAFTNAFAQLLGLGTGGAKAGTWLADTLIGIPKKVAADLVNWIMAKSAASQATGSGADIANYAMTFLGKIPYVWGGTSLTGCDCSGFTGAIYKHFGINAPRTSEAQYSWAKKSPPVAGGLAFYVSPAGGAPPGHVAIVRSAQQVISQGGGMGPQLMAINAMPLMGTGIPPGGFASGSAGGTTGGKMSASQISSLWTSLGGPGYAAANMAQIAFAESGDDPSIVQSGEPPQLTGYGLYQITPTSGISQNGSFGNLLNAANNTRAAISLFSAQGYSPWASDPVGRSLSAAPFGYAKGGIIREPVIGFGTVTGNQYAIAENGPEAVTPVGRIQSQSSLVGNVYITLPEGQTVAKALTDVNYWLTVARQQNYVGVLPGG